MPAKGEEYNKINIDLAQWATDYIQKYRLNRSELARRLGLNRGRVTEMLKGRINTQKYVTIAVTRAEVGRWLAMMHYAKDQEARDFLLQHDWEDRLSPQEKELWKRLEANTKLLIESGKAKDLIKAQEHLLNGSISKQQRKKPKKKKVK